MPYDNLRSPPWPPGGCEGSRAHGRSRDPGSGPPHVHAGARHAPAGRGAGRCGTRGGREIGSRVPWTESELVGSAPDVGDSGEAERVRAEKSYQLVPLENNRIFCFEAVPDFWLDLEWFFSPEPRLPAPDPGGALLTVP